MFLCMNTKRVNFLASPEEWEAWTEAADKVGMSVSAWIRGCCKAVQTGAGMIEIVPDLGDMPAVNKLREIEREQGTAAMLRAVPVLCRKCRLSGKSNCECGDQ